MHTPVAKFNRQGSWLAAFAALVFATSAAAVVIDLSEVGNPGNPPDPYSGSKYGAVPYVFSIGTYDVTVSQYVEFLNAKDPTGTNTLRLYAIGMSDGKYGGIKLSPGNPAGTKYSVLSGRGKWPATHITFYNAIRFANWLDNGQGSGDTETGAYTLGALDANAVPVAPRSHTTPPRVSGSRRKTSGTRPPMATPPTPKALGTTSFQPAVAGSPQRASRVRYRILQTSRELAARPWAPGRSSRPTWVPVPERPAPTAPSIWAATSFSGTKRFSTTPPRLGASAAVHTPAPSWISFRPRGTAPIQRPTFSATWDSAWRAAIPT